MVKQNFLCLCMAGISKTQKFILQQQFDRNWDIVYMAVQITQIWEAKIASPIRNTFEKSIFDQVYAVCRLPDCIYIYIL